MANQQTHGIIQSIQYVIPGSQVDYSEFRDISFKDFPYSQYSNKISGLLLSGSKVKIWYKFNSETISVFSISRKPPLTRPEIKVLRLLPNTLTALSVQPGPRAIELSQRLAARQSLEDNWVAATLRRKLHAGNYWLQARLIYLLKELTFLRYEGNRCTSGFIFSSRPNLFIIKLQKEHQNIITFSPYKQAIDIRDDLFNDPVTHRYVDGQNSWHMVDNNHILRGVIRLTQPSKFSIIDRENLFHTGHIVYKMPGRSFAASVGRMSTIDIVTSSGTTFIWQNNHWQFLDRNLPISVLKMSRIDQGLAKILLKIIISLSRLRMGAAILIANSDDRPSTVGNIGESKLGSSLRNQVIGWSLIDLLKHNMVLKFLSSDGLTTINSQGQIIGCGDIIRLDPKYQQSGGGRTQAIVTASNYGLSIKVSEDGPISFYLDGVCLLKM